MKRKKNYEVADILELIRISNEFIERNKKVYERLASGIPTQGIIDALIPELVDLYGDYVIQINLYESDESYIALAILVTDDYDVSAHMSIFSQRQRLLGKYNDQYGDATLSIMEYQYSIIANPEVHHSQAYAIRKGDVLWKRSDKRYILNSLISELVNLYDDYVMQIIQYKTNLADITLAVLTSSDYNTDAHAPICRKRQGIMEKYNNQYGATTLVIVGYSYEAVHNPEIHDPMTDMIRGGKVIWERKGLQE